MTEWKQINPFWSLSDTFTVHEAAALIAGFDPNAVAAGGEFFRNIENGLTDSDGITVVTTVLVALTKAIATPRPKLRAQLRYDAEPRYVGGIDNLEERGLWGGEDVSEVKDCDGTAYVLTPQPNLHKTTIDREDLIAWLRSRGHTTGFFFPDAASAAPDYLNPKFPNGYAPKLAAAVNAWLAVQAMPDTKGRTIKQALVKWLRENAATYGLTDDEGKVNETGIEEVAKVANWETKGGVPKTPGS
jgi:hypothetical protein